MIQDYNKKEALFNEVKGSLFEYLVARGLAVAAGDEISFLRSLDQNYLAVLSQQDRMVRQFYPEILPFLNEVSTATVIAVTTHLGEVPSGPQLLGKFSNSIMIDDLHEADIMVMSKQGKLPISLKLNKANAFVNTKSGGIKSFFSMYFPYLEQETQEEFNRLVDLEFSRMAIELHALHDLEYQGNFQQWARAGFSELPGELPPQERLILHAYYARIASEMHKIFQQALVKDKEGFSRSLAPLCGFGNANIMQVICFHDFKHGSAPLTQIHSFSSLLGALEEVRILPFADTASVEVRMKNWNLQVRVKPMNKFTTTAIKINCSVKVMGDA